MPSEEAMGRLNAWSYIVHNNEYMNKPCPGLQIFPLALSGSLAGESAFMPTSTLIFSSP